MTTQNQILLTTSPPNNSPTETQSTSIKADPQSTVVVSPSAQDALISAVLTNSAGVGLGITLCFTGVFILIKWLDLGNAIGKFVEAQRLGADAISDLADSVKGLTSEMVSVSANQQRGLALLDRVDDKIDRVMDSADDIARTVIEIKQQKH